MAVTPLIGATKFLNGVPLVPEVVGGSGREYFTPQQGLDLEVATVTPDVTAAGTADGVIKTTIVVVANQFNGQKVVITDPAAVNGGIAEVATVIDTVAPDTLVLDRPFNAGVGKTYAIIKPKKIVVNANFEDSVLSVTGDAEIVLSGIVKQINVTGVVKYLKVVGGVIRDGFSWLSTDIGVAIFDGTEIKQREGTDDAVKMAPIGVNAHALEMYNAKAYGRVRGQTENTRWILSNVTNPGVINAAGFNNAFSVVNADAVALAPANVLLSANRVDGSLSLYHAESGGDITGGAFTDMRCFMGGGPTVTADTSAPSKNVTICQVDDTATLAVTVLTPSYIESDIVIDHNFAVLGARASSGVASTTLNVPLFVVMTTGKAGAIVTDGVCSGTDTVTFDADATFNLTDSVQMYGIDLSGAFTGVARITAGAGSINVQDAGLFAPFRFNASQVVGAPTGFYEPTTFLLGVGFVNIFHIESGQTISVGTWTDSAQHWGKKVDTFHNTLPTILDDEVTLQGIVLVGSSWFRTGDDDFGFSTPGDGVIRRARNGAAVTLVTSGAARFSGGSHIGTQVCTATTVAGAVALTSGATFFFAQAYAGFGGFVMVVNAGVLGAVASVTGEVTYHKCNFADTGMVGARSVVGGSASIPSTFRIRYSNFAGTFTLVTGGGAFAGVGSVFVLVCRFEDVVTIDGSDFTSWTAEESIFNGNPHALTFVTVDPTTFNFFKCLFPRGQFFTTTASLTLGKPIIWDDIIQIESDQSINPFRALELTGVFRVSELDATADNCVGISQTTIGAAGLPVPILVHGWGFMETSGTVVTQNDALEPDNVAGGFMITASVKRTGYAVTATTGVGVETFYGRIHVDR